MSQRWRLRTDWMVALPYIAPDAKATPPMRKPLHLVLCHNHRDPLRLTNVTTNFRALMLVALLAPTARWSPKPVVTPPLLAPQSTTPVLLPTRYIDVDATTIFPGLGGPATGQGVYAGIGGNAFQWPFNVIADNPRSRLLSRLRMSRTARRTISAPLSMWRRFQNRACRAKTR
jgi:hypothetical protein